MGKQIELLQAGAHERSRVGGDQHRYDPEARDPEARLPPLSLWRLGIFFLLGFSFAVFGLSLSGMLPFKRVPVFSSHAIFSEVNSFLYDRELLLSDRITPLRDIIEDRLPWARSNISWNWDVSELSNQLEAIPLLLNPQMRRCSVWSFRCFEIDAQVREPEMYASLNGSWWLLDSAGRYLSPIADARNEKLPTITGLDAYRDNPRMLRSATTQLARTLQFLEDATGAAVSQLELRPPDALHVRFVGLDAPFVIDPLSLSKSTLRSLAGKMKSILSLNDTRESEVKSIDLRYEGMAVVKRAQLSLAE